MHFVVDLAGPLSSSGSLDWNDAPLLKTSCHKARDERSKINSYRYIRHTKPEIFQVHQLSKTNTMGHPTVLSEHPLHFVMHRMRKENHLSK